MKYLLQKYCAEHEISDLDLNNDDEIFGHNAEGHEYQSIVGYDEKLNNGFYWARENNRINIDTAIKILTDLKKTDANYVEILHHSDHHAYIFYGVEMREATKEEEEKYKIILEQKRNDEKNKQIMELEKKLSKLKNKI